MAFLTAAPLPSLPARRVPSAKCTVRAVVPIGVDVSDALPVRDRILVRVLQNETLSTGGLVLTNDKSTRPKMGVIVGLPPGPNTWTGDNFKIGDTVMWKHDFVAEVVQDSLDDMGGRIVSMRTGNTIAMY